VTYQARRCSLRTESHEP